MIRRDIFRVKGQAKPGEIPEHGLFCSWLDMEFTGDKAPPADNSEISNLCTHTETCTHVHVHAPEQTSSLLSAGEASVTVSEARGFI